MLIENSDALKTYLTSALGRICDADPAALSNYILALLKKERTETDLRLFCLDQLEIFLQQNTKQFVEDLFQTLKTKSYIDPLPSKESDNEKDSNQNCENVPKSNRGRREKKLKESRKGSESDFLEKESKKRVCEKENHSSSLSPHSRSSSRDRELDKDQENDSSFATHTSLKNREEYGEQKSTDSQRISPYDINSVPLNTRNISKRCKDYDEMGYCLRGDLCFFDHPDPVVVEDVSVLNFGVSLVPSNDNNAICEHAKKDACKSPPLPPPPPPPPAMSPPPPSLPLPPTVGYIPEPYNPEQPAISNAQTYYMPSNTALQVPSYLHQTRSNVKPLRSRELIGVPTVDEVISPKKKLPAAKDSSSLTVPITQRKRKGFDYSRLGPKPKRHFVSESLSKTLQLKRVPKLVNSISLLYGHFSKFGNITNIEVSHNGDPEAALVTFSTPAEASAAFKSADAVLNNRFIQVFYYNEENTEHKNKTEIKEEIPLNRETSEMRMSGKEKERNVQKDALSKTVELYKKKQQFLESHIKQQKIIGAKLKTTKNEKERAALKKMLDDLGSLLGNSQTPKLQTPYTKSEAEKELLDVEMDLYKTLNKGDEKEKTAMLLTKVNELKQKAKTFSLLDSSSPHEIGLKAKRGGHHFPKSNPKLLKIDNRPKTLLVTGIQDKEALKNFLNQKSTDAEKIEENKSGFTVSLNTRKAAERMLLTLTLNGREKLGEEFHVSWFQEDQHSVSEDVKDVKDSVHFVDGDEDEDEDEEEDSEARSWRR